MKYLEFYKKCLLDGYLPYSGLCACFGGNDAYFQLVMPKYFDSKYEYWGNDYREKYSYDITSFVWEREFNPLRQNIVLLMAAMNGEL